MTISYKTWFAVKLLHEFFNHEMFTDCFLEPAADTKKSFFTGASWLHRFIDNTLHVLIKEDGSGKPGLPVPMEKYFRFYLTSNNPLFFNYTNIDARLSKGHILYLSNFANNEIDATLNLSVPLSAYSATTDYYPGNMVTKSNTVYESVVQSQNKLPSANSDIWLERSNKQYVSGADIIKLSPVNYRYKFTDAVKSFTAIVKGFKVSGNTLAEYDVFTVDQFFPNAVTDVQLDFSALLPGRYKIILTGVKATNSTILNGEEIIYYDPAINYKKAFGIVEIFNCIDAANNYALQNNTGAILETNYTISFANRTAWWNYITKTETFAGIETDITGLSFANPDASHKKLFVSNLPLPFVKQFDYTPFTVSGTSPPKELPWPSPTVLKSEKDGSGVITKIFTEVYINY